MINYGRSVVTIADQLFGTDDTLSQEEKIKKAQKVYDSVLHAFPALRTMMIESEKKVKDIFAKAKKAEKAIIFFDEFEAIGAKRTDNSDNGNNDLVPQILAEMQGVGSSANKAVIIVIAATNKPWAIDSAFMRPGRFDEKIYIPLPDLEARKRLFELQLKNLPISSDLDFDYLAKITDGFNGADIKEVCEKLKMSAINDSLEKGEEQTIGMDDVHRVEGSIKSSVSLEDIERLQEFEEGIK